MIFKKIISLLLLLSCIFFGNAQEKIVFNIDSLPIKSFKNIGGYQQSKICINGKNKSKIFDDLFLKKMDLKNDISKITIVNNDLHQYLTVGSVLHDGSNWNDVFILGYLRSSRELVKDFITKDSFQTDIGISLGMESEDVIRTMSIIPSINTTKDSIMMLRYYFYDFQDHSYEFYRMPKYMIAFRFVNNRLVKLGFGNYQGFFDQDFSLEGFDYYDEIKEFIKQNYLK